MAPTVRGPYLNYPERRLMTENEKSTLLTRQQILASGIAMAARSPSCQ
jgi:hypothetical protein